MNEATASQRMNCSAEFSALVRNSSAADVQKLRLLSPNADTFCRLFAEAPEACEEDVPDQPFVTAVHRAISRCATHTIRTNHKALLATALRLIKAHEDATIVDALSDAERKELADDQHRDAVECCAAALVQHNLAAQLEILMLEEPLIARAERSTLFESMAHHLKPAGTSMVASLVIYAVACNAYDCARILLLSEKVARNIPLYDYQRVLVQLREHFDALVALQEESADKVLYFVEREDIERARVAFAGLDTLQAPLQVLAHAHKRKREHGQLNTNAPKSALRQINAEEVAAKVALERKRAELSKMRTEQERVAQLLNSSLNSVRALGARAQREHEEQSAGESDSELDVDDKIMPHKRAVAFLKRFERARVARDKEWRNMRSGPGACHRKLDRTVELEQYEELAGALHNYSHHLRRKIKECADDAALLKARRQEVTQQPRPQTSPSATSAADLPGCAAVKAIDFDTYLQDD